MGASQKGGKAADLGLRKLARVVTPNLDKAGRALPKAERDAYRATQQSVVDARRRAGTHEGLLRIG